MSNELKIGLTVILAVIAAYMGFRFMSDTPIFRQSNEIEATFEQVDGLGTGALVLMNGVRIGSVQAISLAPDNRVRVTLAIDRDVSIPVDSRAELASTGLLDGKAILIRVGSSGQMVQHGDEIEGRYIESMMEILGDQGQEISEDISASFNELNRFLVQLNHALDDESSQAIHQAIRNIESTTTAVTGILTSRQQELEDAITSTSRLMGRLDTMAADNQPRVDSLLANLEESSQEFKIMSTELGYTIDQLNQILVKINEGEGTLGKLVNDPSLYENSDSLTVEMRNLIRGINENPGRYLRHMNLIEIF